MVEHNDILDDMDQVNGKSRHGCVSAWLIFMIISYAVAALVYFVFYDRILDMMPEEALDKMPDINPIFMGVLSLLNLVFAVLLLKWQKIGFWGFVATSVISLGLSMSAGMGVSSIVAGLFGIVLLYGILQIPKDEVAAWKHLE